MKSQLTTEIKRLEQEHRTISQNYRKQLDVIKKIDTDVKKPKDDDDKKALELRKAVADKEKGELLDKLNKTEELQNQYDDKLRELTKSAPSVASTSDITAKDDARSIFSAYLRYLEGTYNRMDITEIRAALNQLSERNLGYQFNDDFSDNVLKKRRLPTEVYSMVMAMVQDDRTLKRIKQLLETKIP